MADIFISYKREDKQLAERLSISLEQLGFNVWWDLNLISGQPYRAAIRAVIDQCKAAIVLWSAKSVESEFVMDEASYAHRLGKLCPARIDDVELPMGFGQTHTADLIGWDGEFNHSGFQNVVAAVEARIGRKGRLGASTRTPEAETAAAELEAFKTAQYAGNSQALRAFLKHFPRGDFAGFVRGQLETMPAEARAGEAAAAHEVRLPPPAQQPTSSPQGESPLAASSPQDWGLTDSGKVAGKALPWPLIAGGLAIVALAAVFWPRGQTTGEEPAAYEEAAYPADGAPADPTLDPAAAPAEAPADPAAAPADPAAASYFASYDINQLESHVRAAAIEARAAESRANAAAARARQAARRGEANGSRAPQNGVGIDIWDSGNFVGDRYAGEFGAGVRSGVGVFVYGQNPNNIANSLRYEGEWASDRRNGVGIYHWRSGNRHAGAFRDNRIEGTGVHYFNTGERYEGEWANDRRGGYGALWDAQGQVSQQGIWANDTLTTPLSR
jgi:hypothetical protein